MAIPTKKSKVSKNVKIKKPATKARKVKSATKKALLKSPIFIKSETKSDFLEQLSSIKQTKAKAKILADRPLSLRNNLSLALLSPYRLPIDANKLAMQSARIAGMAFVIIGSLLTIFHLPVVNDELVQNIQNVAGRTQMAQVNSDCGDCGGPLISQTNQFTATISVTPNYDTKNYLTKINTSGATRAEIKLVDSAGGVKTIGYGVKQDSTSGSWLHTWDASNASPGTYKIFGSVTNSYGTYATSKVTITVLQSEAITVTPPPPPPPPVGSDSTDTDAIYVAPPPPPPVGSIDPTDTEAIYVVPPPSPPPVGSESTNTISTEFSLSVSNASDLSGIVEIGIKVTDATAVEMFVLPKNATTPRYLGLASIKAKGEWLYRWNTANTPNGDYRLYAVAKLSSGKTNSPYKSVRVDNAVVITEDVVTTTELVRDDGIDSETDPLLITGTLPPPPPPPPPLYYETEQKIAEVAEEYETEVFVRQFEDFVKLMPSPEEMESIEAELDKLLDEYEIDIENEIENLTIALRSGDQEQVDLITKRIEELQNKILKNSFVFGDESYLSFIGQRLGEEFGGLTDKVTYTEKIIKERVGEEVFKDTDGDGISDYDETVLYGTDPTSADSDSDGFTDGAEILNGYNPTDAAGEAAVVFESPQTQGLERKDILAVNSIETSKRIENAGENEEAEHTLAALIKGKGLPNSFVTLYIFSTPVIVTVKTDAEGNWEYTFDKELEDGEHEVYVGITDNAGSIVAKSEPLRFIKTAEAYTPIAEAKNAEVTFTQSDPGFLTQNMIMFVMSISVVIIGLILMLLGLHLKTRRGGVSGEHLVQEGFVTT